MKRKIFKCLGLLAIILVIFAAAVPFAVPPLAEMIVLTKLQPLGLPFIFKTDLSYCWTTNGPGISGRCFAEIANSPWTVKTTFGASFGEWHARVQLDETAFDEQDKTLRRILDEHPINGVSNLVFSGKVALDATVQRTRKMPVPVWSVKSSLKDVSADLFSNGKPVSIRKFSVRPAASGIADHIDIAPLYLRADEIKAYNFTFTNFFASVRATETGFLVTEAGADTCGGELHLYSLFLNPERLNAGATIFVENLNSGELFSHFAKFKGTATGHLQGKIKLYLKNGRELKIRDAFLHSTPGETGNLKLEDASPVTDNLTLAGVDEATRDNAANALSNLDYSALRLNLNRTSADTAELKVLLKGSATRGETTAPVTLNLTFTGALEQLINLGLGISQIGKDKSK